MISQLVAVLVLATLPAEGAIDGVVLDRATQRPVERASVTMAGAQQAAIADAEGRFHFAAVQPGTWSLRVSCVGYQTILVSDVVVSKGRSTEVHVVLDQATFELPPVEVAADFVKPREVKTTSYNLNYEEVRRSPGALGDVSRLIQSLPGVVVSSDQRNDVIARGGSPIENLTLVDNVEVPNLSHFGAPGGTGGPISMLNNELVRDATFLAGGFSAEYGLRLSSVLDIRLREGARERTRAELDLSFGGAGLLVEGPLGARGTWLATYRRSYLELLAKPFGLEAVPATTDFQGKVNLPLDAENTLWIVNVSGASSVKFEVDHEDLEDPNLINVKDTGWTTVTGANWKHLFGSRGHAVVGLSDAVAHYGVDAFDEQLGNQLVYRDRSTDGETTLKADLSCRLGGRVDLRTGAMARRHRLNYDLDQPLGAENPWSTDPTRVDTLDLNKGFSAMTAGGYAQVSRPLFGRSDLSLGARVDRFDRIEATTLSPRAALAVHLTPRLDLNLSTGRFRQQPPLVYVTAVPANRRLDPIQADHYVGGLSYLPAAGLKLSVEAYHKEYRRYPVARDYPSVSLANTGDLYVVAGMLFPMVSEGRGHSNGIEFYVQKKLTGSFYGQASYSISRVRHEARDGVERRGSYDVPNTATLIAGYRLGQKWEFSGRWSYASGRPYTPPKEPESTEQNRYIYDLARINGARAREYHRLDLRVDHRYLFFGRAVTFFMEVENVYDRLNIFQYQWNPKTRSLDNVAQLSFLPIMGANVEF